MSHAIDIFRLIYIQKIPSDYFLECLTFKSSLKLFNLEIVSWQEDNSLESISFLLISRARDSWASTNLSCSSYNRSSCFSNSIFLSFKASIMHACTKRLLAQQSLPCLGVYLCACEGRGCTPRDGNPPFHISYGGIVFVCLFAALATFSKRDVQIDHCSCASHL